MLLFREHFFSNYLIHPILNVQTLKNRGHKKRRRSFDKWVRKFFKRIRIEILKKRIKKAPIFRSFFR